MHFDLFGIRHAKCEHSHWSSGGVEQNAGFNGRLNEKFQ